MPPATTLVLLGTAGGPLPSLVRHGIAQAVVVGDRTYLVDCGSGVTRQLRRSRLLSGLHSVFLTHLHSDHTCDYFNLFLLGWPILQWNPPVAVWGPGPAGGPRSFPPDHPGRPLPVVQPDDPTPGLVALTAGHVRAHAYDLNIRMRQAGRRDLTPLVDAHEIEVPPALGAAGPDRVAPTTEPFAVCEDDRVRVTATLVDHAPVFPSFAFRFDTDDGSIVLSGDTAPCANLVRLARGADLLVHEVYDDAGMGEGGDDDGQGEGDREGAVSGGPDEDWECERRRQHLATSHTAIGDVGRVASEAEVRRLVLTHFIPGDDTRPDRHWHQGVAGHFDGQVVVGHDLAELRP